MAENDFGIEPDRNELPNNDRQDHVPTNDAAAGRTDEYELTAKDAGWRTPTLPISPANFVYFDPPRKKKPRES